MLFINKYLLYTYYPTAESRSDSHITSFTPSTSQSSVGPTHGHTNNAIVLITAVCVSAGFLLLLLVIILVTTVLLLKRVINKQKSGIITSVELDIIFSAELCIHLHFQLVPQSQIIFLLMIILFTLQ